MFSHSMELLREDLYKGAHNVHISSSPRAAWNTIDL